MERAINRLCLLGFFFFFLVFCFGFLFYSFNFLMIFFILYLAGNSNISIKISWKNVDCILRIKLFTLYAFCIPWIGANKNLYTLNYRMCSLTGVVAVLQFLE